MNPLVYFSSSSENTHRFVNKLGLPAVRIPLDEPHKTLSHGTSNHGVLRDKTQHHQRLHAGMLRIEAPYILLLPTYGGGSAKGAVPKQVIHFLNDPHNRSLIRGVIAAGNTNFGAAYCIAGDIIAQKCQVPYLYRFELMGTPEDVLMVKKGVIEFWQRQL